MDDEVGWLLMDKQSTLCKGGKVAAGDGLERHASTHELEAIQYRKEKQQQSFKRERTLPDVRCRHLM